MAGFQFKQFFIAHNKCAMKVNTDGILLGAFAEVTDAKQIIDLGTGTGLVAIMLAQRSAPDCHIIGVEIEPNAYLQAVENAQNSAWANRIRIIHSDVLAFTPNNKVDLVVANPPYFSNSLTSRSNERNLARMAVQSHLSWLEQAQNWLTPTGKITLILPFEAGNILIEKSKLACVEKVEIQTKPNTPPKRIVVTFSPNEVEMRQRSLLIYDEKHHYTEDFKQLTQAFYLKF